MLSIIHKHLHMKKLSARWVLRLLTMYQNVFEWIILKIKPSDFLLKFVAVDHYTSVTKQQSKQWTFTEESARKNPKIVYRKHELLGLWDIPFLTKNLTNIQNTSNKFLNLKLKIYLKINLKDKSLNEKLFWKKWEIIL